MKPQKAIEILDIMATDRSSAFLPDERTAMLLGREALKFFEDWRQGRYFPASYLLPGETKD